MNKDSQKELSKTLEKDVQKRKEQSHGMDQRMTGMKRLAGRI